MISLFVMLEDAISIMGSSRTKPKVYACKGEKVQLLHKNMDGTVVLKNLRTGEHFPARFNHLQEFIEDK